MSHSSPFPHFLVIGGMKCATTTLHQDLIQHPRVVCGQKELNALTFCDGVRPGRGSSGEIYQRNFRGAEAGTLRGDVSTTYSMLPDYPGVPRKARSLCGADLKIIYLVRNPVRRTLSHHQHMMNRSGEDAMGPDINEAIIQHRALIDYSCYARQITPWLDIFGREQVFPIPFEHYVRNRQKTIRTVFEFLEVEPFEIAVDPEGANRTGSARVAGKHLSQLYRSTTFQKYVRPLMPVSLRKLVRPLLLKKTEHATIPPTPETLDRILDGVVPDAERFHQRVGWKTPVWDWGVTRQQILGLPGASVS